MLDRAREPGMISFAGGVPAADRFPVELLARLAAETIADDGARSLQYGPTAGEPGARRVLAGLYDPSPDGSIVEPDDVVVTSGAQQAIDLVARVLLEPGDAVACGDPDYLGFLSVLRDHGVRPHPVPIDGDGLDVERLGDALAGGLTIRACYLVPHHHNPTGATIGAERRRELHRLSTRYGFVVIEDDPYRSLHVDETGPIEADADPELTIRIRSTSKILTPGLRIGVLTGPRAVTEAVITMKQATDLHTSSLSQALVAAALDTGFLDDHVAGLRTAYRAKLDVVMGSLRDRLGDRVQVETPGGGMFVWLRAPGIDTTAWLDRAIARGACFVPGPAVAVEADLSEWARLSFVTASEDELVTGVERLADALVDG